ncbi:serine/threonine protein kinase [Halorientalis brevis]|uniref:Serine/threonine protein kinase n=1 Tax=Halorientalis brevis TaxID=1126241 RepID=A0ABD6C859_9EURY|nr:hypothetical protein [Halorientalis brevis]
MGTNARSPDDESSRPWTDPRSVLRTLLSTPDEQPDLADADLRRSLVAGLADEDPTIRFSSTWAIRLLARDQPNALPGLVGYLVANRDASDDVRNVLVVLLDRYPDLVRPVLTERDVDPDALSADHDGALALPAGDDDNDDAVVFREDHDGKTIIPTYGSSADFLTTALDGNRQLVETPGEVPTVIERAMDDASTTGGGDPDRRDADQESEDQTDDAAPDPTDRAAPWSATQQKRADIEHIEGSDLFETIRSQCRFDDLEVVLPRDGRRYADTVRARARTGSEESGIALRLLDRPDSDADDGDYAATVGEQLARWQGASAIEGVVTVHDWAADPRPWLATEPVEEPISEWTPPSVAARLRCGLHLAESVADCHRQGVVHAGIDPGNVVRSGDALTVAWRPKLDNVGLLFALREYFDLGEYLDLRYAAPEYFDARYGSIDHSTDVYQLGTVLYRLFTDRAPFEGGESEVHEQVLTAEPPAPTEVNPALPDAVDDVIWKATAKRKLVRYETATQLRADLKRSCEEAGVDIDI